MSLAQSNVYLGRICSKVGVVDPQLAVERLLLGYRTDGEALESVAARLGIERVTEVPLPFDGGIFSIGGGGNEIRLNASASPSRKKFTLAHEIGHLVLDSMRSSKSTLSCTRSINLERACDAIAAELLMPKAQLTAAVRQLQSSSPENLRTLADRFGVSLCAVAVRVHQDLRLWKRSIGLWRWQASLQEMWFVGRRPWDTKSPEFGAFESARDSRETVRGFDVCRRGEYVEPVSLELLNLGRGSILGLVGVTS